MKVKELIKKLQKLNPELEVRLVADHGQVLMSCTSVCESYIESDEYMADEIHPDDLDEWEGSAIQVVVLEAY